MFLLLPVGAIAGGADAAAKSARDGSVTSPGCGASGFVRARLYGEISDSLRWSSDELQCQGMPRPGGAGARLRFAGNTDDGGRRLAIILAIPELSRDTVDGELAAKVTLIEVGNGRFFSTSDTGNCLADISAMTALDASGERYSIAGAVYCVSPLAEINGRSSVSIPELHFTGLIDWSTS